MAGATRTVDTQFGPVALPVDPRRVVAINYLDVDFALVLGLPLVGAGSFVRGTPQLAPYQPADQLAAVELLASPPNFEQIAALRPDAIIVGYVDDDRSYDRLTAIAPTFAFGDRLYYPEEAGGEFREGWRGGLVAVAEAFGRGRDAERVLADFASRTAATRSRLGDRWAGARFALVMAMEGGTVNVATTNEGLPRLLTEDLGLMPVAATDDVYDEETSNISLERLDLLADADVLFVRVPPATDGSGRDRGLLDQLLASPLWRRVPAVAAGHAHEFPQELNYPSPLTVRAFLAVVEAALVG